MISRREFFLSTGVLLSFMLATPKLLADEKDSLIQDLQKLKAIIAQANTPAEAKSLISRTVPKLGIKFEDLFPEPNQYSFSFTQPIDAQVFCRAMEWSRPYGEAVDVHQTRWRIALWKGDLENSYGRPRIYTGFPKFGKWAVDPHLKGRPEGKLPGLSVGASPAYDLWTYKAEVIGMTVELWKPGWHS